MKLDFDIDIEDFQQLIKQPCHYCGLNHSNHIKDRSSGVTKGGRKYDYVVSDAVLDFNGIDRIDSNIGYMKNNVVTCCKHCNSAKNSMTEPEFIGFISRIYHYYCLR